MADRSKIEWTDASWNPMVRVGKSAAGRLLDGVAHDAMPEAARS